MPMLPMPSVTGSHSLPPLLLMVLLSVHEHPDERDLADFKLLSP